MSLRERFQPSSITEEPFASALTTKSRVAAAPVLVLPTLIPSRPQRKSRPPPTPRGGSKARSHHGRRGVASGAVRCARCRQSINPLGPWDIDHSDDRRGYLDPSHRSCNRATAGGRVRKEIPPDDPANNVLESERSAVEQAVGSVAVTVASVHNRREDARPDESPVHDDRQGHTFSGISRFGNGVAVSRERMGSGAVHGKKKMARNSIACEQLRETVWAEPPHRSAQAPWRGLRLTQLSRVQRLNVLRRS